MLECKVFEVRIGNKFCKIASLYRLPNKSQGEFETFTENLLLTLDKIVETNPFLVIAQENLNAKLSQWYKNDKTRTEGSNIANLTSGLLITPQLNLVMESCIRLSLHSNCHHQIIYARFLLKIYYLPPYECEFDFTKY